MLNPETLALIFVIFAAAGFVKGVIGLGLPTLSVALLTATVGLKEAMVLMLLPSFVTNVWQGLVGGALLVVLRRIWTLLLAASVGIWFSVSLLVWADVALLSGVLGVLLCIYSGFSLLTPQVPPPGRWEGWLSPAIGAVNGFFTGITGSSVVPGVLYLQALGMERDALVQAMGVLFTVSTGVLAAALAGSNLLSMEMGVLSGVALVPSFLGMVLGQRIRRLLPESRFRKVFFTALLILGAYIIMRNLF